MGMGEWRGARSAEWRMANGAPRDSRILAILTGRSLTFSLAGMMDEDATRPSVSIVREMCRWKVYL